MLKDLAPSASTRAGRRVLEDSKLEDLSAAVGIAWGLAGFEELAVVAFAAST